MFVHSSDATQSKCVEWIFTYRWNRRDGDDDDEDDSGEGDGGHKYLINLPVYAELFTVDNRTENGDSNA